MQPFIAAQRTKATLKGAAPQVDWSAVDATLRSVPGELRDARFDPLKFVLNTLSSTHADAELEKLRKVQERVEFLVDDIVSSYYNGFNKAIHNYSQILQLFSEAKSQVDVLREALEVARKRLGSHSSALNSTWRRTTIHNDTLRLLDEVATIVNTPELIQKYQEAKEYDKAATLLLETCNKVIRLEIEKITALKDIRRELPLRRSILMVTLVQDIMKAMYFEGAAAQNEEPQTSSPTKKTQQLDVKALKAMSEDQAVCNLRDRAAGDTSKSTMSVSHLVAILLSITDATEIKAAFAKNRGGHFHRMIYKVLEEAAQRSVGLPLLPPSANQSLAMDVPALVKESAEKVVLQLGGACLKALMNLRDGLIVLSQSKVTSNRAGLDVLLTEWEGPRKKSTDSTKDNVEKLSGTDYVASQLQGSWLIVQKELQELLATMFHATRAEPEKGPGDSADARLAVEDSGRLTFSFAAEAAAQQSPLARAASQPDEQKAAAGDKDLRELLSEILVGYPPGSYLVPIVYRPIAQFADEALRLLECMTDTQPDGNTTQRFIDATANRNNLQLKMFLENFVRLEFLPQVYVDFRGQCNSVLSSPDALRARTRLRADELAAEANVLPVAEFAERAVDTLLGWAAQMPMFASNLAGVVENILGRVLDAFESRATTIMGKSLSAKLADDPQMLHLLSSEDAAMELGDPLAFVPRKSGENVDAVLQEIKKQGLGTGGVQSTMDVLRRLLKHRPISPTQVIASPGEGAHLVQLAALSDSLDYIAAVIKRCTAKYLGKPEGDDMPSSFRKRSTQSDSMADSNTGLSHLINKYIMLSGYITRTLRLEKIVISISYLQELPKSSYVCEEDEVKEVDECIGALCRAISRANEGIVPWLSKSKRDYIFGTVGELSATTIMWMMPEIRGINAHGVARMCHMLNALQPALCSVACPPGQTRPQAARAMDTTRSYYQLLTFSADALLRNAAANPTKFTMQEWSAIFKVNVPGRTVTAEQKQQLHDILAKAWPTAPRAP